MADVTWKPAIGSPKAGGVSTVKWETLTSANSGGTVYESSPGDRSVQVVGTPGGATIALQGSNDGTTYVTLTDAATGDPLTFANTTGLKQPLEFTRYVKPVLTTGTSETTDVDVYLTERGT